MLPALSVARTWKPWLPSASAGEIECGLLHDVQPPPSIWHSKLEPVSFEPKLKLGVVLPEGSDGCESMVVLGAVRSTVQL